MHKACSKKQNTILRLKTCFESSFQQKIVEREGLSLPPSTPDFLIVDIYIEITEGQETWKHRRVFVIFTSLFNKDPQFRL